jgi:hypothetical protein
MTDFEQMLIGIVRHLDTQNSCIEDITNLLADKDLTSIDLPRGDIQKVYNEYCYHSDQALKVSRRLQNYLLREKL